MASKNLMEELPLGIGEYFSNNYKTPHDFK